MIGKQTDSGVSPVIGVILMVAVTVALVALVTVVVFDIGGDVSESPDATVDIDQSNSNVTATILRNENVESFTLQDEDGNTADVGSSAGDSGSLDTSNLTDGETVSVIATMPDGSEEVLTSTTYNA